MKSTASLETLAGLKLSIGCLRSAGDCLFWIEGRPELAGARVVVRLEPGGEPHVVSPDGLSLSSRVHEYGGGAMTVIGSADAPMVVGVRTGDQAIVSFEPGEKTPRVHFVEHGTAFGGLTRGPGFSVVAVREHHDDDHAGRRDLVLVDLERSRVNSLVSGRDFYSDPIWDAESGRIWWCAWDHPSMPWDASELWTAVLEADGVVSGAVRLAGGPTSPASQPSLLGVGEVGFAWEQEAPAQLWSWSEGSGLAQRARSDGEVSQPPWSLATASIAAIGSSGDAAAVHRNEGRSEMCLVVDDTLSIVDAGAGGSVDEVTPTETGVAWLGTGDRCLGYVARLRSDRSVETTRLGPRVGGDVAIAESISVQGPAGVVHGLVYEPATLNPAGPRPAVVFCHGGPTAEALPGFNPIIEAVVSRGFTVIAANYAGSTGFGPAYRHRLDEAWGIADVDDCVALVAGLGSIGRIDASRVAIRGTSAGGFTALLALTTGAFLGAVSWYGVADLIRLSESTHDFESRYLDRLVGSLPEHRDRYVDRSPVTRAGVMEGSALLLQGLDDVVVPPAQSAAMADAMRTRGHEVELIEFEGEGHGFRRLDTLTSALTAEISFYERILGRVDPLEVDSIGDR